MRDYLLFGGFASNEISFVRLILSIIDGSPSWEEEKRGKVCCMRTGQGEHGLDWET